MCLAIGLMYCILAYNGRLIFVHATLKVYECSCMDNLYACWLNVLQFFSVAYIMKSNFSFF